MEDYCPRLGLQRHVGCIRVWRQYIRSKLLLPRFTIALRINNTAPADLMLVPGLPKLVRIIA